MDTCRFGVFSGTPHYVPSIPIVPSIPVVPSLPSVTTVFQALQTFKVNKDYLAIVIMPRVYLIFTLLCVLLLLQNCTKYSHCYQHDLVCSYVLGKVRVTLFNYRGRYLSWQIPYPSNGSFNPFAISNKEVHIWNGNINGSENTEQFRRSSSFSVCNSSSDGLLCRSHFQNYCLSHFGKFSCAVDCFLELCYAVFRTWLHNITRNIFFDIIYESCIARQNLGAVDIVREPVWSYIRNFCPSFSAMTADAVFSDIFTIRTLGNLSENLNSLFLIQQTSQKCCTLCGNRIIKTGNIIILYITCSNPISTNLENHVSEAVLPSTRALYCDICQRQSGDICGMQHFVTLPTFLNIELSSQCVDRIHFPLNADVLGNFYTLKAVVRCASHHFTIAINRGTHWVYYDMCAKVQEYLNFHIFICCFHIAMFGSLLSMKNVA